MLRLYFFWMFTAPVSITGNRFNLTFFSASCSDFYLCCISIYFLYSINCHSVLARLDRIHNYACSQYCLRHLFIHIQYYKRGFTTKATPFYINFVVSSCKNCLWRVVSITGLLVDVGVCENSFNVRSKLWYMQQYVSYVWSEAYWQNVSVYRKRVHYLRSVIGV